MTDERKLFEEAYSAYLLPAEANWFKRLEFYPDIYAFEDAQEAWCIWQIARSPYWLSRKEVHCCEGGPQWGHAWNCKTLP